ncbi:MAG: hypothetical protein LBG80_15615 [Bacteroidales bacterium]|jgi:hypothetical protein|nr:hypothetical protein [Bacteroidales bacterium]
MRQKIGGKNMRLIDLDDKERILFYANKVFSKKVNIFLDKSESDSYYVSHDETKEYCADIMEYNIESITEFREVLEKIWTDDKYNNAKLLINICMAATYKSNVNVPADHITPALYSRHINTGNSSDTLSFTNYMF